MSVPVDDIITRFDVVDAELLHDTDLTRVYRLKGRQGRSSVILKQPLSWDAEARVQHERTILERLASVQGVPVCVAGAVDVPDCLLLEDTRGALLADILHFGAVVPEEAFKIAIALTGVLIEVHRRGVAHRDINPSNILVGDGALTVQLIDFDLASIFSDEISSFANITQLSGTLAYMAPEQTGRTGRLLDKRGDLYSLGATLYALVTGAPPFGQGDPLQIVHDHLATVPTPPVDRNANVPKALSQIILRLLAKEPDDRYQSAEGLAFDLATAHGLWREGKDAEFSLGEKDFPARLIAPSRLAGRESERELLKQCFDETVRGAGSTVLVAGAPGVGKSRLLDEVRAWLTPVGGLFAAGKFEQYQQDGGHDGVLQAVRGLLRLLLAEPENSLLSLRERLKEDLGANAGLAAAVLPEIASLLDTAADATALDVLTASARLQQIVQCLLRAVASPSRPVVLVIDDLQWASRGAFEILDAIVLDEDLRSVLVLASFRDNEIDAGHPLRSYVDRWHRLGRPPREIRLENLPAAPLKRMLEDVLKLTTQRADELGTLVNELTRGNPFDTLEVLNALRRDGALRLESSGWQWDAGAVRGLLMGRDVGTLVAQRVAKLAQETTYLLEMMSCLPGEIPIALLSAAAGMNMRQVRERLAPALENGLLVADRSSDCLKFRHDRVHQAVYARLEDASRRQLLLSVARRLWETAAYRAAATEPYSCAAEDLREPAEMQRAVELFRSASASGRMRANHVQTEHFARTALAVLDRFPHDADRLQSGRLHVEMDLHVALYSQGRLAEADAAYRCVLATPCDPVILADSASTQISSLVQRGRPTDAVALGLEFLGRLGVAVPKSPRQFESEIGAGMAALIDWIQHTELRQDLERPEYDSPRLIAIACIITRSMPAAYFADKAVLAWLVAAAGRIWREEGPAAELSGPLSHAAFITIASNDYRRGNEILRRVLDVADARGYETDGAQARFTYALSSAHWFRPVEEGVTEVRRAQDALLRAGELHFRSLGYFSLLPNLLDCAATVDQIEAEAETAVSLCRSMGNEQALAAFIAYRQFARSMRGDTSELASFTDKSFDESDYVSHLAMNPVAAANYHVTRALAAILSGDTERFLHHVDAAQPAMAVIHATYLMATARVLEMLAVACRARAASSPQRELLLAELDERHTWLAERAADAPGNFLHLLHLIDAERCWAHDDFRGGMQAYDAAHCAALKVWRPWHRALILEQAARFHEAYGLTATAPLLRQRACDAYKIWGAKAKVATLSGDVITSVEPAKAAASWGRSDAMLETIRASSRQHEELDLLAILRAAQELRSETDLDLLRKNVGTVLKGLTGATSIRLAVWSADAHDWLIASENGEVPARDLPLKQAIEAGLLPASAFRYAQRTRELLVVDDALSDVRFLRDEYFKGMVRCSLLVVPVVARGELKAMLVLENRVAQAAFSPRRLDGVLLIAGQLATCLESVMLSASIERRVAQRVRSLGEDNERLLKLSHTDPLTGLANRRLLDDSLRELTRQAARVREPVALIMLDIDCFKQFNDRYGHQAGDQCLAKVAAAIRGSARGSDLVARYGGEEFVVLLSNTDVEVARVAAERIRKHVAALAHAHEGSPHKVVTVSVGVAALVPQDETAVDQLVERADHALYHSKRRGRNCVSVDPSHPANASSAANF